MTLSKDNCNGLAQRLQVALLDGVKAYQGKDGVCVLRTPFHDQSGDPIEILVREEGSNYVFDDGGIISGHLYSLGQQAIDSPAFKLLDNLSKAYDFRIDFDSGSVILPALEEEPIGRLLDLVKVVITLTTATPFISVSPVRPKIGGQRLRAKIRKAYVEQQILDIVEQNVRLEGESVEDWLVDFHWQVKTTGGPRDVYVVALDLELGSPLQKAERVASLALDTRGKSGTNLLRVVIDKYEGSSALSQSEAAMAARFLSTHKDTLRYSLYDFDMESQRKDFIGQSVEELTGDMGAEWRDLWLRRKPKTLRSPVILR